MSAAAGPAYLTLREGVQIALGHLIDKGTLAANARGYAEDLLLGVFREWLYDLPERDGLTGGSDANSPSAVDSDDPARLENHYGYCTLSPDHSGPCAATTEASS